jgi:RHS repeat-associated protein
VPPSKPIEWLLGEFAPKTEREGALAQLWIISWNGPDPSFLGAIPAQFAYIARATFTLRDGPRNPARPPRVQLNPRGQRIEETDDRGATRRWQYDLAGNLVAEQDRDGRVQQYTVASWNLRGSRVNEIGQAVQYKYDKLAEVVEVTDPFGNVTRYDYDQRKRLTRVHRHGRVREEYIYDVGSHFIEKRDGDGNVLFTNEPHANHFVAKRTLASGGFHKFDYDERGRTTEASTQEHEVKLAYRFSEWPISDLRDGIGVQHSRSTEEDRSLFLGKFRQRRALDGTCTRLVDSSGKETTLAFEQGLVRRTCPNGTIEILQYDPEGRLLARLVYKSPREPASLSLASVPSSSLASGSIAPAPPSTPASRRQDAWATRYGYTLAGDLIRIDDSVRGTTQFEIDNAHRLAAEITPQQERLVYYQDAADNVLVKPGLAGQRFNAGNLIAASSDEQFEHDARNHLALRKHQDGSEVRYVYDSFDMLVSIERKDVNGAVSIWQASYDAIGRRIKAAFAGKTRAFFWDYERLAGEIQPDGHLRVYQYASRTARVPISFTDYESPDADPNSGHSYVVFSDPVGMPLCIEDQDGKVVWWAERVDPYGAIEVAPGATLEYNLRWPGHYYDPETGLHYNRWRYYDPGLARYLQSDPVGYDGSPINLYSYCANPLVNVDLLGLNGDGCKTDLGDSHSRDKENEGKEEPAKPSPDPEPPPPTTPAAARATKKPTPDQVAEIHAALKAGDHQHAIDLTVQHYGIDTTNVPGGPRYDPTEGNYGTTKYDGSMTIGPAACASPDILASTVVHETTHSNQAAAQRAADPSRTDWPTDANSVNYDEASAYQSELDSAPNTGLDGNKSEMGVARARRNDHYRNLPPDLKQNFDQGKYPP